MLRDVCCQGFLETRALTEPCHMLWSERLVVPPYIRLLCFCLFSPLPPNVCVCAYVCRTAPAGKRTHWHFAHLQFTLQTPLGTQPMQDTRAVLRIDDQRKGSKNVIGNNVIISSLFCVCSWCFSPFFYSNVALSFCLAFWLNTMCVLLKLCTFCFACVCIINCFPSLFI